jgi:hypothetical protein
MTPEQAAEKYHWIKYNSSTNTIELFLDHHMLSWARSCEAGFVLEHMLHIKPNYGKVRAEEVRTDIIGQEGIPIRVFKSSFDGKNSLPVYTEKRKPWFLDFGEYLHYMFEVFYKSFIHKEINNGYLFDHLLTPDQQCLNLMDFLQIGKKVWMLMDMDWYGVVEKVGGKEKIREKEYEEIGGWKGVSALLTEYYVYYMDLRVRIIDTEIIFGYNREVPIGEFELYEPWHCIGTCRDKPGSELTHYTVKCYLTGRIDLLIDNGSKIGPVDHKSTKRFDGYEADDYNPQDAITGYIYAARCILEKNYPKYFDKGRECLDGWIYHISKLEPSTPRDKSKDRQPRFKQTPIHKTHSQFEDFKARQLSTYKRICELLFNDKTPEWNTLICNNVFMRPCQFKEIHRQPSEEWENAIKHHYVIGKSWNPRERDSDKLDEILRKEKL